MRWRTVHLPPLKPPLEFEADGLDGLAQEFPEPHRLHHPLPVTPVLDEHGEHPLQGTNFSLGDGEPALGELLVARQRLDGQLHAGERASQLVSERRAERGHLKRRRRPQECVEVHHPAVASPAHQ
jgi:hypothetical protein